jgi:hypothetical protein
MSWPSAPRGAGAVTSRVFDPGTGWTLAEARELLSQGYAVEHVVRTTGYPARMLRPGTPAHVRTG